jgi:hypothetical protein
MNGAHTKRSNKFMFEQVPKDEKLGVLKHPIPMLIAMNDSGFKGSTDRRFEVIFHGKKIGIFIPDLIIKNAVIVELKKLRTFVG